MRLLRATRPIALVAALALIIGATLTSTASAQDVQGQRDRVQKLAAQLDAMQAKSSVLDEQYLQTKIDLQKAQDQVAETKAALDQSKANMATAKAQAGDYIVSAYMGAGSDVAALGVGDPNTAVNEKVLLETLHGDRQQVADDLRAAQVDLDARSADLEKSSQALADKQAQQRSVKSDLEASVNAQQQLLNGANADLRAAVQAEQDRQAAAAAAKAQQAQEQAQAKAAAAAAATTTSAAKATATKGTAAASAATAPAKTSSSKPKTPAPTPTPVAPVAPVSGGAGAAIAAAQSVLGVPYKWAGASPSGFDCSGLVMWAWAHAGKSLPHSSSGQYAATQHISVDQLQPGDLVFFYSPISHVGIYIGGGMMIHAPHTGDVVKVAPITRMGGNIRAGRVA